MNNSDIEKRASGFHQSTFVADLHCDAVLQMRRGCDISKRNEDYHVDIPRLREGGVNLQVFACSLNPNEKDKNPFETINSQLDVLHKAADQHSSEIVVCRNSDEIRQAYADKKIGMILAIEGGEPLENDPANVEKFYDRGVRLITLAHQRSPGWCTSWNIEDRETNALTDLGHDMIAEMNRLGVIVDLSHSSRSTFWKAVDASDAPIVASHSCADSLSATERNLTDDQIRAVAESGGVIGVTFIHFLLSPKFNKVYWDFWKDNSEVGDELQSLFVSHIPESEKAERWARHAEVFEEQDKAIADVLPSVETVADHIDYIVKLAGIDHVAIGSDFDGVIPLPRGLEDCSCMPNLTIELIRRGYSDNDIEMILGANFSRIIREVCE